MGKKLQSISFDEHAMDKLSQKRLFYRSPYKKAAGTSSPIGLPDNHIYERINRSHSLSKSWQGTQLHHTMDASRKVLRFLEPGIWDFQDPVSEASSDFGHYCHAYDNSSQRNDTPVSGYHEKDNLTLPRLPTIEQMFDTTNDQHYATNEHENNRIKLPNVFNDKLVIINSEDKISSDDDSEPIMQNSFGSLKKIDKVFSSKDQPTSLLLPPIAPRHRRKSMVNSACSNNDGDHAHHHVESEKKKKGKVLRLTKGKVKSKSKSVHFSDNDRKSHTRKVEPKLPKVVGLKLTVSEIEERELPPVVTKFLIRYKCQSVNHVIITMAQ